MDGPAAAEHLRAQLASVRGHSPLYERLLVGLAGAAERGFDGGVTARLLALDGPSNIVEARLLLLAALHHAALEDPALPHAQWFPTAVDRDQVRPPTEGAPAALALAYLVEHETAVTGFLTGHRLQTNEIGRCAALLPGFLVAAGFGLPLRLRELGASAGLALRFDRYRYDYQGGPNWGARTGPTLHARAEGVVPERLAPPTVEVSERRGVDLSPVDATSEEGRRLLHAFLWPDEHDRHERLDQALQVAAATPATVDTGDLAEWAATEAEPTDGVTTVLYHSQVRYQLDDATAQRLDDTVDRAARSATPDGPFVSLAFEPPRGTPLAAPELLVTVGDGSGPPRRWTLLTGDFHGRWVRWW